jgi:hypothetical protein
MSADIPWEHRSTAYLPEGSRHKETCRECDEFWPCPTFSDGVTPQALEAVANETSTTGQRFMALARFEMIRRGQEPPDQAVLARI